MHKYFARTAWMSCWSLVSVCGAQDAQNEILTDLRSNYAKLQEATLGATFLGCERGSAGQWVRAEHPVGKPGDRVLASWSGSSLVTATVRPVEGSGETLARATYFQGSRGLDLLPQFGRLSQSSSLSAMTEPGWPQCAVGFVGQAPVTLLLETADLRVHDDTSADAEVSVGDMAVTLRLSFLPAPINSWVIRRSSWIDTRLGRTCVDIDFASFCNTSWGIIPRMMTLKARISDSDALRSRFALAASAMVIDGAWFASMAGSARVFKDDAGYHVTPTGAQNFVDTQIDKLAARGSGDSSETRVNWAPSEIALASWPPVSDVLDTSRFLYNISRGYCVQLALSGLASLHAIRGKTAERLLEAHPESPTPVAPVLDTAREFLPQLVIAEQPLDPRLGTLCAIWGTREFPGHAAVLRAEAGGARWHVWEPPNRMYSGDLETIRKRFEGAVLLTAARSGGSDDSGARPITYILCAFGGICALAALFGFLRRRPPAALFLIPWILVSACTEGGPSPSATASVERSFFETRSTTVHVAKPPDQEVLVPLRFRNTRDEPCVIALAHPDCGCLTLSERASIRVAPGQRDVLFVRARPSSYGIQKKTVAATAKWKDSATTEQCDIVIVAGDGHQISPNPVVVRSGRGSMMGSAVTLIGPGASPPDIVADDLDVSFSLEHSRKLSENDDGIPFMRWVYSVIIADDARAGAHSGTLVWKHAPGSTKAKFLLDIVE